MRARVCVSFSSRDMRRRLLLCVASVAIVFASEPGVDAGLPARRVAAVRVAAARVVAAVVAALGVRGLRIPRLAVFLAREVFRVRVSVARVRGAVGVARAARVAAVVATGRVRRARIRPLAALLANEVLVDAVEVAHVRRRARAVGPAGAMGVAAVVATTCLTRVVHGLRISGAARRAAARDSRSGEHREEKTRRRLPARHCLTPWSSSLW